MAKPGGRGCALDLKLHKFSMDHFAIDDNWFEVSKLVLELTFLVFASKEVDAVLDGVRLFTKESQTKLKDY